jgi:hypothetical protein
MANYTILHLILIFFLDAIVRKLHWIRNQTRKSESIYVENTSAQIRTIYVSLIFFYNVVVLFTLGEIESPLYDIKFGAAQLFYY